MWLELIIDYITNFNIGLLSVVGNISASIRIYIFILRISVNLKKFMQSMIFIVYI